MPVAAFDAHLRDLADQGRVLADAAAGPGVSARDWQIPSAAPTPGDWDLQNPQYWQEALDRTTLNAAYVTAVESATRLRGAAMAAKAAVDYMGAYERAAQARHASPARCRAWAGARREGHGDTRGPFGAVRTQLLVWEGAANVLVNPAQPQESELEAQG